MAEHRGKMELREVGKEETVAKQGKTSWKPAGRLAWLGGVYLSFEEPDILVNWSRLGKLALVDVGTFAAIVLGVGVPLW